jgi:hypothetical protein
MLLHKYKVSNFFGAYTVILTKHPRLKSADLSSMKNIIFGEAAFPHHYKQKIERYLRNSVIRTAELGGIGCLKSRS